jgi:hypothetical protein
MINEILLIEAAAIAAFRSGGVVTLPAVRSIVQSEEFVSDYRIRKVLRHMVNAEILYLDSNCYRWNPESYLSSCIRDADAESQSEMQK